QISIYPSPAKDQLIIKFNGKELYVVKVTLFNLAGEVVFSSVENHSHELTIDISSLPNAMYIIEIDNNENRMIKQIVKEQ
ncbi:MAG: T9SS type A sorting domain-containing protein, partial [Saprospiraceae bacterium]